MFDDTIDFEKYLSYNDSSFENQIDDNANFNDLSFTHGNHSFDEKQDNIEISTNIKSNLNENHSEKKDNFSIIESSNTIIELSNGDNSSNKFYSFDDITEKFQNSDFNEKLKKNSIIEEREQKLCIRKRKRNKTSQGNQDKKNEN